MGAKGSIKPEVAFRNRTNRRKSNKTKESQMEAAQAVEMQETVEAVEPTIVDASEAQVFPELAEVVTQETEQSEAATAAEPTTQEVATAEKPVEKAKRVNKRPYLEHLRRLLEEGKYTRKELVDNIMAAFPAVNKGGVTTVVSDLKNEKYNIFKDRRVVVTEGDKLIFADCLPETGPETEAEPLAEMATAEPTQAEQPEQPAE